MGGLQEAEDYHHSLREDYLKSLGYH